MARAYSQDLRDRVIDAALAGAPARQAAARFGIGDATAIVWVRRARQSGERTARKQGQPRRCKLDPYRDYILGLIMATPDLLSVNYWRGFLLNAACAPRGRPCGRFSTAAA